VDITSVKKRQSQGAWLPAVIQLYVLTIQSFWFNINQANPAVGGISEKQDFPYKIRCDFSDSGIITIEDGCSARADAIQNLFFG